MTQVIKEFEYGLITLEEAVNLLFEIRNAMNAEHMLYSAEYQKNNRKMMSNIEKLFKIERKR